MNAGRELDALVAEKVMGLDVVKGEAAKLWPFMHWIDCGVLGINQTPVDPYTTSIADAWPVFCRFTSRYLWYDDATDAWHCHVDPTRRVMSDCRYHATSEDESGAEAICLAALKACGVEIESLKE